MKFIKNYLKSRKALKLAKRWHTDYLWCSRNDAIDFLIDRLKVTGFNEHNINYVIKHF